MANRHGNGYCLNVIAAFAAACWNLAAMSAGAQALTLEKTVELALERAPQLQAQQARVDGARSQSIAAGRLPDPELIVGVDNLPVTGEDAWSAQRDFMTMRKVGVMQALPSSRKRASQRERAAAFVSLTQREAQQAKLEIAQAAANAWLAVHTAEMALEQLRILQPEVELQSGAARAALASGRGSTVDALAAQEDISELQDRLFSAEREVLTARAQLARWIGEDGQRALDTAAIFDDLPAPRERLLASVHRHAPLLTFEAQRSLARSEIELAQAEKRSDWSAELAFAKRGAGFSDMVSLEFRVGLPVFSRYRQDPLIAAKRAELAELDAQREAELRMHAAQVMSALGSWEAARKRIAIYRDERLPLARQRSQAALAGFHAGRLELTALLASRAAEIELQRDHAQLVRELGESWVFLRYLQAERETP